MDLFTIPFQGRDILYKPRRHLAFVGNTALTEYLRDRHKTPATARDPEIEGFLEAVSFDRPGLECATVSLDKGQPFPTDVALLMTNQCNLHCIYCYANAGEESHRSEIDWPTAKAAIDFVLANADRPGASPPSLTFHGGGEPTVHWKMLVRAVEYAREHNPRTRVSMSSNGIWSDNQRRFICQHFTDVSLSMDGEPALQNRQRPRTDGGESSTSVLESIRAMDSAGIEYGIRMTVLPGSTDLLPQNVRFICENTKAKAIQIEPTFTSSRGHYADIELQFADAFSQQFMQAWRIGRDASRQVYYSGARPWVIAPMFCQAPLKAVVVTADARLVTCFEVFSEQSPHAGTFTVGRIRDGRVEYDRPALQAFLDAQQRRRQECVDCFCYWHCCGDCATRRPGGRDTASGRCRATRNITLALLLAFMEEQDGVWQGLRETTSPNPPTSEQEKT